MAESWLRLHVDILDNPKIRELPPKLFMDWTLTMVVAKKHGGILPPLDRYAFEMRISKNDAKKILENLTYRGLIDQTGENLTMHDWQYWQFENGTSEKQKSSAAARMQRFRERQRNEGVTSVTESVTGDAVKRNVSVTGGVTNVTRDGSRARTDSETDSDTERNVTTVTQRVTASVTLESRVCDSLDRICAAHPKPDGIAAGRKVLESELVNAVNPEELAARIERRHALYVASVRDTELRFVKTLGNWARDRGYLDPDPSPGHSGNSNGRKPTMAEQDEMVRKATAAQLAKRGSA